jgi:hypothetical protein
MARLGRAYFVHRDKGTLGNAENERVVGLFDRFVRQARFLWIEISVGTLTTMRFCSNFWSGYEELMLFQSLTANLKPKYLGYDDRGIPEVSPK